MEKSLFTLSDARGMLRMSGIEFRSRVWVLNTTIAREKLPGDMNQSWDEALPSTRL